MGFFNKKRFKAFSEDTSEKFKQGVKTAARDLGTAGKYVGRQTASAARAGLKAGSESLKEDYRFRAAERRKDTIAIRAAERRERAKLAASRLRSSGSGFGGGDLFGGDLFGSVDSDKMLGLSKPKPKRMKRKKKGSRSRQVTISF